MDSCLIPLSPFDKIGKAGSVLLGQGLAEERVLMVNPVLLGTGKRLFAEGTAPRAFTLDSSKALSSGIVINIFKAAGTLQNLK